MKDFIPTIYGTVTDDGRFHADDPIAFKNAFVMLRNKNVEVSIKERRKRRSDRQNAYYWGVVVKMLSEHTGYSPDQMHSILKQIFNSEVAMVGGIECRIEKSTTKLSTYDFSEEYIRSIQQWAAEKFDLQIPDPNEVEY